MKKILYIKGKYTRIIIISCICLIIVLTECTSSMKYSKTFQNDNNIQNEYRGLKPKEMSEKQIRDRLLKHYSDWSSFYVKSVSGENQKYVDYMIERRIASDASLSEKEAVTVSEAHGYGMLILVNMANVNPKNSDIYQKDFNDFVRFYQAHPSSIDPTLMCWLTVFNGLQEDRGSGKIPEIINTLQGSDCATDGDLDIAYSLILADRIWGSEGELDYLSMAKQYSKAILKNLVSEEGRLLLGDWVKDDDFYSITRSSDLLVRNLYAFRELDEKNAEKWN